MTLSETLSIIAILVSPVFAVSITLWYTKQQDKRRQKMNLFLTLIATRKELPTPARFVDALNMIDVVFNGNNKVISAWKTLFASYQTHPFDNQAIKNADNKLLDLLDVMAKSLGYKDIKQTDYDAFYSPVLFSEQMFFQQNLNKELLRVLQNSESFGQPKQ